MSGDKTDCAVLCTDDKTYEVREAETSNTLLLSPDCLLPDQLDVDESIAHKNVCTRHLCQIYRVLYVGTSLTFSWDNDIAKAGQ